MKADLAASWRTTPFQLALRFGAAYVVGVALLLGLVYLQTAGYLTRRVDGILADEARIFIQAGPEDIVRRIEQEARRRPLDDFALYSASGQFLGGDAELAPAETGKRRASEFQPSPHRPMVRALVQPLPWGEVLVVARDSSQLMELRSTLLFALIISGALILVLGLLAGLALSREALKRIQSMRVASERIAAGDLAVRLPVCGRGDELDAMAAIVNTMMEEMERLMLHAQTAGESISHELRTPLTRLRAMLERAQDAYPACDPGRETLEQCVAEADSVLARFRALLRIAAVEAKRRTAEIAALDLSGLMEQAGELYAPLAADEGLGFDVEVEAGVTARVDRDLFLEAVANLLDNALKFTPSGGRVRLALARAGGGFVVEVADTGPGVPEAERALVTDRFYRSAAHHAVPGHGLGLSLVAAVARMHGLVLTIADNAPGTRVRLGTSHAG